MNMIIGGFIIISLLSRPSVIKTDFIAYEVFKTRQNIIKVITKEYENRENVTVSSEIDNLLAKNNDNFRQLVSLVKKKNYVSGRFQVLMQLREASRVPFSQNQIKAISEFGKTYSEENTKLMSAIKNIESKKLLQSSISELLQKDSSFEIIYGELKNINDYQLDAIDRLKAIINKGNEMLAIL